MAVAADLCFLQDELSAMGTLYLGAISGRRLRCRAMNLRRSGDPRPFYYQELELAVPAASLAFADVFSAGGTGLVSQFPVTPFRVA